MTCILETKKGVIWEVVPEIEAAQEVIAKAYLDAKAKAVVTSAHDGNHSSKSAHKQYDPKAKAQAIDLRITNLYKDMPLGVKPWMERVLAFGHDLAIALEQVPVPGSFVVLLEKDHFHLEFVPPGKVANIIGYKPDQSVYTSAQVKGYLA